jgi:hypothetical protein
VFVDVALLELAVETPADLPAIVLTADALTLPPSRLGTAFDLVVGNPPYGKTRLSLPWRLADYGYAVSTGPLVWNRHKDQLSDRPSVRLRKRCSRLGRFLSLARKSRPD